MSIAERKKVIYNEFRLLEVDGPGGWRQMRATQKQIAEELGVSPITVHRALNNTGYVSEKLKRIILDYARKVDYVPHRASRTLVRNRTRRIAVFSSENPGYFWNSVRTGVDIAARQIAAFDYQVRYCMIPDADSRAYLRRLKASIEQGTEAVGLVNQWMYDMDDIFAFLDRHGIPYVTFNVDAPHSRRSFFIGPDYPEGGRLAAEFLGQALQFKRRAHVLVVSSKTNATTRSNAPDINGQRVSGFLSVMQNEFDRIGVDVRYVGPGCHSEEAGRETEHLLELAMGEFDAVYLVIPHHQPLVSTIERLGLQGKVLTVVHDLDPLTDRYFHDRCFTAVVHQNPIFQGYYTVKMLEGILESGHPPQTDHINLVHSLILRENRDSDRNHSALTQILDGWTWW